MNHIIYSAARVATTMLFSTVKRLTTYWPRAYRVRTPRLWRARACPPRPPRRTSASAAPLSTCPATARGAKGAGRRYIGVRGAAPRELSRRARALLASVFSFCCVSFCAAESLSEAHSSPSLALRSLTSSMSGGLRTQLHSSSRTAWHRVGTLSLRFTGGVDTPAMLRTSDRSPNTASICASAIFSRPGMVRYTLTNLLL
eukprot:scaffold101924_cov58-Phaeocystis_antarctica.AAC.8